MTSSILANSATRASIWSVSNPYAVGERKGDVFGDRERIKQGAGLKDHGDAAANLHQAVFGPIGDVFAGDDHAALVGLEKAHDVLERYRFAHAAAAHDDAGLSGIDEEADVVEDQMIVEGLRNVAKFDVVVGHVCCAKRSALRARQLRLAHCASVGR